MMSRLSKGLAAGVLVRKVAVRNGPANDARLCFDFDPPRGLREGSFVGEIFDHHEFAVVPRLPSALADIVENVDDLAALHFRLGIIHLCDYAQRNAMNF